MSDVEPLDALGRDLAAALERDLPRVRRRRRVLGIGALLALLAAVPAAGTVTNWAGLAGGETPLPTQVPDGLRLRLAGATDARGSWRLEVYRAALAGGGVGTCLFVSRAGGGTGRCSSDDALGPLVDTGQDPAVGVAAGVVRGAARRVEVTLERYDGTGRRVVAVTPAAASGELEPRDFPPDLRSYAVVLGPGEVGPVGVRALDAGGRRLGSSGRPAPVAPAVPARPSPVIEESQP